MNTALENETGPPIALDLNFGPRAAAPPTVAVPLPPTDVQEPTVEAVEQKSFWEQVLVSVATQSWLASMAFHMALMIVLALVLGTIHAAHSLGTGQMFEAVDQALSNEPEIEHFNIGNSPLDPTDITTESLTQIQPPTVEAQYNDASPEFERAGGGSEDATSQLPGMGGFSFSQALGPSLQKGGVDAGAGFSNNPGVGGAGSAFGNRGKGHLDGVLGGPTAQSERAVSGALNWIARHQNRDGSWSLLYTKNCKGSHCSCPGERTDDTGATALALLPFLAAGQTHQSKGPYEKKINDGINWLIRHQKKNGDLSTGDSQMYEHGLAAIALCEAYGMTQDSRIGYAAQDAINFIESAQNKEGGWRYTHGTDDSDTSVFGWQVMALKSGQMAGLKVSPNVLTACKKYLNSCSRGEYKSEFSYTPGGRSTISMTAVGLLTSQYLGARRGDPVISGGLDFLMQYKPVIKERNTYYWYYATQAMHNVPGPEWDEWNRHMRRILIETQEKNTGCANGSWNPNEPEPDPWGNQGGRLMVTSFCTLTLEVYYRYLPLYQLDDTGKKAVTKVE
jgi:Squalene-hopene cyclase C-terminal domain